MDHFLVNRNDFLSSHFKKDNNLNHINFIFVIQITLNVKNYFVPKIDFQKYYFKINQNFKWDSNNYIIVNNYYLMETSFTLN